MSARPEFRKDLKEQREIIIEGVVRPLGFNVDDSLRQLSFKFPERKPANDEFQLDVPIIVPQFPGISWLQTVNSAGFYVSSYLRGEIGSNHVHPWVDPRGVNIPEGPHGLWVQKGGLFVERRPIDVREELQLEKYTALQAGGLWAGFALGLLRWDIVKNKGWDLIGDSVGSDCVPFLSSWDDGPSFDASLGGDADPGYRALVCGR